MIQLHINVDSAKELTTTIQELAGQFGVKLSNAQADMVAEAETPKEVTKEAPKKEEKLKKEKAKKGKAKKEEPKTEAKEEKAQAPKDAKSYTKKDIGAACQSVASEKSLDAAKEILQKYGAVRISEVKTEDYAAFVADCEAAVK